MGFGVLAAALGLVVGAAVFEALALGVALAGREFDIFAALARAAGLRRRRARALGRDAVDQGQELAGGRVVR